MTFRLAGALGALMIIGSTGCERREEPSPREVTTPSVTTPESPEKVTTPVGAERKSAVPAPEVKGKSANAINAITKERCAREQRCGNVGHNEKFASESECLTKTRSDWAEDLNAYECPGGIDQKELSECLEEIRDEDCNNPFDKLGRMMACRASDICRNVPTR